MEAQRSLDWYRKRIGQFTGSRIGELMKTNRKSNEEFGETALSYIYSVAAEREMNPSIISDNELFEMYISQTSIFSKALQWGVDQEENARELYERITNYRVVEVGLCQHPTIANFASSPDGFIYDENNKEKGVLEIKCPSQATFIRYKQTIKGAADLLFVKPEYFYQCQAHMMVSGANWCDFVTYCPFQNKPIHIVRILPDRNIFASIEARINEANKYVNQIINKA